MTLWAGIAALALPSVVGAQFAQYTRPGDLATETTGTTREQVERALEEARWQLGPVRLDPWFGLQDTSWVDNPTAEADGGEDDFTATVGAGLKAYLPTGPKVFWSAHALPEYVWWRRLDERNRLNGRYGLGLFGFFNHLEIEALASRREIQTVVSAEEPERINSRQDRFSLGTRLLLTPKTALFAEGTVQEIENLLGAEERQIAGPFDRLNRDEVVLRGGVRYQVRDNVSLGVGIETTEVDFTDPDFDRSNEGLAPIFELDVDRGKLRIESSFAWRDLESRGDSSFTTYEGLTGHLIVRLVGNRLEIIPYVRRDLSFSLDFAYSHYEHDVGGLATNLDVGTRSVLRVYGEVGTSRYEAVDPSAPERQRDFVAYGTELAIDLPWDLSLTFGADRVAYGSSLVDDERELTSLRIGLIVSGGPSPWI